MVGGFLAELIVFAIVFSVLYLFGQQAFLASILIASAVMPFIFAVWVGRGIESRFVIHGALVGLVAALIYIGLAWGQPQPLLYQDRSRTQGRRWHGWRRSSVAPEISGQTYHTVLGLDTAAATRRGSCAAAQQTPLPARDSAAAPEQGADELVRHARPRENARSCASERRRGRTR